MKTAKLHSHMAFVKGDMAFDPSIPVETSDSELDDIVYRLSHDLRGSVRALQDLPCWLVEDLEAERITLPDGPARQLDMIADHANRIDAMLNGLLEYSRVGRMQPITAVRPRDVFADVVEDLAPGEEIAISAEIDGGMVQMGVVDLHRLFAIPLTNAIRFHPTRTPKIKVTAGPVAERTWAFEVADDGPGIPPDKRLQVFRPMVKLVSRDVDPGAGMGLAVLRKLADCYNGTVEIDTPKSGKGTLIRTTLMVN